LLLEDRPGDGQRGGVGVDGRGSFPGRLHRLSCQGPERADRIAAVDGHLTDRDAASGGRLDDLEHGPVVAEPDPHEGVHAQQPAQPGLAPGVVAQGPQRQLAQDNLQLAAFQRLDLRLLREFHDQQVGQRLVRRIAAIDGAAEADRLGDRAGRQQMHQ